MTVAALQTRTTGGARRTGRPRVLHVVDFPGAGWDALAAAAACAGSLPADQRLLLIGDRHARSDAGAFGLVPDYQLCPPLNRLPATVAPLDLLLRDIAVSWPIDVLHVWSDSARLLCRQTVGYSTPITQEDPAPFTASLRLLDRAEARAALGIAEHETALLLAADRPGVGDARRFAGLVGVLHLAEYPAVGIASARSDTQRRSARFLRGFNRAWDVIPLDGPPQVAVAAADIVIYDQGDSLSADAGPGPRTGGIVLAAGALGIPVVTTPSPLSRRLLGPLAGELVAGDGSLPEVARITVHMCTDNNRRRDAGRRLREQAVLHPAPPLFDRWIATLTKGPAA